jgi:hypothetical protein
MATIPPVDSSTNTTVPRRPARGSGASTTVPSIAVEPIIPTTATTVPKRPQRGSAGGLSTTTPGKGIGPPSPITGELPPLALPKAPTVAPGRPISPDLIEAQRNLSTAQAQATRAGVPDATTQAIAAGKEKPNKGLVALGKVIGFDIIPGKGEFKPVESLVLGPASKLDVGRRIILSTLKETGDEVAVWRGTRGRGVGINPETGNPYRSGEGGFNLNDWWKQTNDLTTGYGGFVGNIVDPNALGGKGKYINRGIGFTGDVLLDPLSWAAGPAGIAKKPLIEAVEAGGKKTTLEAAKIAADAAADKAIKTATDVFADTAATALERKAAQAAANKAASEAATIAAEIKNIPIEATTQALEQAAKEGPRRVLGARSREELAQIAREARDVAIRTGNERVASVLTDDVITELGVRGYSAVRGPVADVLGVSGGLRAINPLSAVGIGPDKFRILPQLTEPFTNAIGTGLTGVRVGFPVKNLPRILSVVNKGFVNTRLGNDILQGTTPIGEGGLFGTQDIQKMRVALRSGNIVDPLTGVSRKLTGAEGSDYVRLLAEDRAFRLIAAQTNSDVIRVLAPTLANKGFFKYSNTVGDLLDRKVVTTLPDGTKQLTPAINLLDRTLTAADASSILGRKVSEEEFLFAQQIRGQLEEVYANNNFLNQRQRIAAGYDAADIADLPKNTAFFPHVLTDDARRAAQAKKLPQEALDAMELDRTFALAGATPRELKVGSMWFGKKLEAEDIAGGVKRLNEIAREKVHTYVDGSTVRNPSPIKYNIFETNAENALTRYGQAVAKDNAYTEFLFRMAQATDQSGPFGTGAGQFRGKAFDDIIQTTAQRETVGRTPSTLVGFEEAVDSIISPERVAYMSTDKGRRRALQQIVEDMRAFNAQMAKKAAGKKTQFYDEVNQSISTLEQRVRDLERIKPPFGYPAALDSEGEALLESLLNESKGIVLNVRKVSPDDWKRILPLYDSMFGRFLAINSKVYPGLSGSPEITELLQNVRRLEDPLVAQAMPKALQDTTQMFKAWVTATPGFHTRNALSNVFFMLSAGATPGNMSEGAQYYSAYNKFLKRTEKAAIKGGKSLVESNADRIVEDIVLSSGRIPVGLIDSDPAEFNRLLDLEVRKSLSGLGAGGKTLFNFYLSPEYMDLIGFPRDFNPYLATTSARDKAAYISRVESTYNAILANATSGYGLLGDVFAGGGRRGIAGTTTTRTVRGAETLGEKVLGAKETASRAIAKPLSWSKQAGSKIEDYTRFVLTYDGLKQGLTPEQAAARTAKYLIDYQDLSQADKAIKQFIPFWTWTSRSFPLIVESAWLNPKAYAVYNNLERNLTDTEGEEGQFKPGYFGGAFKLPVGENVYAVPDFGFNRQEEGLGRLTDPMSILSSLSPIYRAPVEAAINQRFQTGEEVYNPYYQDAASSQLKYLIQQILPQQAYAGRLGNVGAGAAQDPLTAALIAIGAGVGGKVGGPAGAILGGAAGTAAGTAGQGIAGQVPTPALLEQLAQLIQGTVNIPGTEIPLIQTGKPSYIEEEQGPFTREESRQKLFSYFGLPVQQLQDYQQVQRIKQIIEQLEQQTVKTKNK